MTSLIALLTIMNLILPVIYSTVHLEAQCQQAALVTFLVIALPMYLAIWRTFDWRRWSIVIRIYRIAVSTKAYETLEYVTEALCQRSKRTRHLISDLQPQVTDVKTWKET